MDLVCRVLEDGNTQGVLNLEILWNRSHANLIERGFTEEEFKGYIILQPL